MSLNPEAVMDPVSFSAGVRPDAHVCLSVCPQSHGSREAERPELSGPAQSDHGGQWRSGEVGPHAPVYV